jgi:uncharacterized protein YhhL (DUF1145 family)
MIKYNFKIDDKFIIDGFKRYRRQHALRSTWLFSKIFLTIFFIILSVISIYHGDYNLLLFIAIVIAFMHFGHRIEYLIIRRRLRKTPHFNENIEIALSESGYHSFSSKAEARAKWSIFTKVVAFRDGLLLFQGPRLYHWLPTAKILEGAVENLVDLVKTNIENYSVIEPVISR